MISFQKIIAWILICLLSFEMTFRTPFFISGANALELGDHEDIVSLLVEEDIFKKISGDLDKYARRIQSKLPHTRTVILTYARDAHPYLIASANERLYFSGLPGHSNQKTQKLVGTILIGHVPIPVVHKENQSFLSLYPYTDFDEPHFFWNWETSRYEYINQAKNNSRPDIWHSVIDPNTGDTDTDATKIREFFARVYEYDDKKGRYENVGADPQVLYMDSINESRSASKGLLAIYEQIFIGQQEHTIYHRFTRDFAQYIYEGYLSLMGSEGKSQLPLFANWIPDAKIDTSFLASAGDITTQIFIKELLTPFLKVINEKYLSDVNRWVHNTGRYYDGYSEVRLDTLPELITKKDALSVQVIKESNDVLEKIIDTYVDNNLSLDIPILVNRSGKKTITEEDKKGGKTIKISRTYDFMYDNYFFGTKASEITSASQCGLIRGSSFGGRNSTVEMNHGYAISDVENDLKRIKADAAAGIKCSAPAQSYWGGNSPLNITGSEDIFTLGNHRYDDFPFPAYDPSAGKTTIGARSPLDCLRNDLILRPYQHNGLQKRRYVWPKETDGKRYSCATNFQGKTPSPFSLDPTPEVYENIFSTLQSCTGDGSIKLLNRNGSPLSTCQANGLSGTYKRISSLIKHSDPTTEIYGKQLSGFTSPNLPVDGERFLQYLDRTASPARIDYPNLFDIQLTIDDTDEIIEAKIRSALSNVQTSFSRSTVFPAGHKWSQLIQPATPTVNLADALLGNTEIRSALISALRWKHLDIEMKYAEGLKMALSSHSINSKLIVPDKKNLYEISYLGGQGDARNFIFGFSPEETSDIPEWFTTIKNAHKNDVRAFPSSLKNDKNTGYTLSPNEIGILLGYSFPGINTGNTPSGQGNGGSGQNPPGSPSQPGNTSPGSGSPSNTTPGSSGQPGSEQPGNTSSSPQQGGTSSTSETPQSIEVYKWFSAIQLWLSKAMKTEWFTPDIDTDDFPESPTYGINDKNDTKTWSNKALKNVPQTDSNLNKILDFVENNKNTLSLINTLSTTTLKPKQALRIDTALEDSVSRINDDTTRIQLEVLRIDDLDEKKSYSAQNAQWGEIQKRYVSLSGSEKLKDGHAVWVLSSLDDNRSRVTIESRIYSEKNVLLRSERNTILVGPSILQVTVIGSSSIESSQTIRAGDPNGLNIFLDATGPLASTADVTLQDYVTGVEMGIYKAVPITNNTIRIGSPAIDTILRRAGRYTVTVVSGDHSGKTNFTIIPEKPHHITASLDPLLIKDTPTKFLLTLRDEFENILDTNDWNIQIESSANIFLSSFSSKTSRIFTGSFTSPLSLTPLESGNTTLTLTATRGSEKIVATLSRPVLPDANIVLEIPNRNTLKVGQEVPLNLSMQRQDGSIIEDWDMSTKVSVKGADAQLSQDSIVFSKGRATVTLKTGTRPGLVSLYLPDTVGGKTIGDSFTILPGEPRILELASPEILYAKHGARDRIKIHIYDAFGNPTSIQGYTLQIIPDKVSLVDILEPAREISTGIFETDIVSRGYPGRVFFRGTLYKEGKKIDIATLENVAVTNIFPVITSEEASNNTWQNITQVLLGGPFGQSPIQGYFGGASLFSSTTKTLALSTLIDTPENPAFTITPSGNIITGSIQYGAGMGVEIESYVDDMLTLIIFDRQRGSIARVRYPVLSKERTGVLCTLDCDRDNMYFTPVSSDISLREGSVYRDEQKLFSITGAIFTSTDVLLTFIHQKGDNLQFSVSYKGQNIGTLSLRWKSRIPVEKTNIDTLGTFTLEPLQSGFLTKLAWSNKSSFEIPSLVGYSPSSSGNFLGGSHREGWSAYPEKYGLGWARQNTSMLQFAAGQSWSRAVQDHTDYLTINLGDPIIHLPNYQVNSQTGLDQTIGEPVYIGTTPIDDFTFRDSNSDGKKDLIVYHNDNTIGLGLNRSDGALIDVGDLLSVRGAQRDMVRAGDFTGDGFSDIVYVDQKGSLRRINHDVNGPTEKPMQYDSTPLLGKIEQLEVFDMDHDGVDDVIVLDHYGSLFIFYGRDTGIFTVQLIEKVYDFVLSNEAKSSYFTGAIRYTGQGFTDPDLLGKNVSLQLRVQQEQARKLLFTQIRLDKNTLTGTAQKTGESLDVLRAPFIDPEFLTITKQYRSLETSGQLLSGSPIEVKMSLQNNSNTNMSGIILLEKYARYLSVAEMKYDIIRGTAKETRPFLTDDSQAGAGIMDLRDVTIAPGTSLTLTYRGSLRSFSFGRFDVGYLEDKNDPTSTKNLPRDTILTINKSATKLNSIPENDFYNHDAYGDIRFNPNETCGGPLLLYRSHNTYDRTYHKTFIVRDITDPDKNIEKPDKNSAQSLNVSGGKNTSGGLSGSSLANTLSSLQNNQSKQLSQSGAQMIQTATDILRAVMTDTDGDSIPDTYDDDPGDIFQIDNQGDTSQAEVVNDALEKANQTIEQRVKNITSGLTCGFGDSNCKSSPINWTYNVPGNTKTTFGYPTPGANQPPVACFNDVRCGYPVVAFPTGKDRKQTWPNEPYGAGGGFDYYGGGPGNYTGNGLDDGPRETSQDSQSPVNTSKKNGTQNSPAQDFVSKPFYSEEGFTPNKNYLADTAPIDPSTNPAASAATKSVQDIHPSQRAFLNGIARTESGFSTKEAYAEYLNSPDVNANVRQYGDIGADYGYYQNNGLDVQDAIRLGVDPEVAQHLNGGGKNGTSTLDQQTLAMHEYVSRKYPTAYENLKSGTPEAFESARDTMDGKWFGLRDTPNLARSEFAKGATGDVYKNVSNARSPQTTNQNNQSGLEQPQNSEGAQSFGKPATPYVPGLGISTFRYFVGITQTGPIAQVWCTGPNNKVYSTPGSFPIDYAGNCIYSVQPITVCSDDGSEDTPLNTELDMSDSLSDTPKSSIYLKNTGTNTTGSGAGSTLGSSILSSVLGNVGVNNSSNGNTTLGATNGTNNTGNTRDNTNTNRYTNADDCDFFRPVTEYPRDLSKTATVYLRSPNDVNVSVLQNNIAQYASLLNNLSGSDTPLGIQMGSTGSPFESLNNQAPGSTSQIPGSTPQNQVPENTSPVVGITLDPSSMKFREFGEVVNINLKSVKDFPNFIMDWYELQMDEIMSSMTHLPDLKIFLPDFESLADRGWEETTKDTVPEGTPKNNTPLKNTAKTILDSASKQLTPESSQEEIQSVVQQKTAGLQNAFEYLSTLPIIHFQPETISYDIPWIGKEQAEAWISRNQGIIEAWRKLPPDENSAGREALIASIESNIETVRSYGELPEKLQDLYYLKEKLLHAIIQNVSAIQNLMGAWLDENGKAYQLWVETYTKMSQLLEPWQGLLDVFSQYEAQCTVCTNERWNLQHWLWIIIPAAIPPLPVTKMPRWMDIELDFTDIDLSLDIAYPVFDLNFVPVIVPDAPSPSINASSIKPMPQFPQIPELNLDVEIPVVRLPNLPNLPPPPKVPDLSESLKKVLELFKLVTRIQCQYRQIPIAPEWYVGTKIAHKTEREGYLPEDFLDARGPYPTQEWLEAIRVATHVSLDYDVDFIIDMLKDALKPFENFPINLNQGTGSSGAGFSGTASTIPVQTTSLVPDTSFAQMQKKVDDRFDAIVRAIHLDIADNQTIQSDLLAWSQGVKKPEDIASLGTKLPNSVHLAKADESQNHLLTLAPSLTQPFLEKYVAPVVAPLALSPLPETVVAPGVGNQFIDTTTQPETVKKTRGLYVTNGSVTQRLMDYTEHLDGKTKIHTVDDDVDGDLDVYYSLGNIIYRKENYTTEVPPYTIKDAPRVYTTTDIYEDFFGIKNSLLSAIPSEGQIYMLQNHSPETVRFQTFAKQNQGHSRLMLFRSLFTTDPKSARYQVDIVPEKDIPFGVQSVPRIDNIDGLVFIEHRSVYRTLMPGNKFIDESGKEEMLAPDFVIRSGQSAYTREVTVFDIIHNGTRTTQKMNVGERIVFQQDSQIDVRKGSLILFGTTQEKRPLTIRDTRMPLLPGDVILTDKNGGVVIGFPDGTKTTIGAGQYWTSIEYSPGLGVKKLSLSVGPEWYYGTLVDARSLPDVRLPHGTLFDAHSLFSVTDPVSQIPPKISLTFPGSTEIDFQQYFPADTLTHVEILRLPSAEWRRVSSTKIAFEGQKESREILVRITASDQVRDYTTRIETTPPTLRIDSVNREGLTAGTISTPANLPMAIQSYIDGKSWNLVSGFSNTPDARFRTTLARDPVTLSLSQGPTSLATLNRATAVPTLFTGITFVPRVVLGQTPGYSLHDSAGERVRVNYQFQNRVFRQVAGIEEIQGAGIFVIGNGLRLEPATLTDTKLVGGAYITDTAYRPLITLDSEGVVRTLDTNISWSVKGENNYVVFTLFKNSQELGKIIFAGETVTTWTR